MATLQNAFSIRQESQPIISTGRGPILPAAARLGAVRVGLGSG
jgi:hypothetical protein